ncbi:MAG TPA: hypothetical protein VK028_01955 [Micromonosporaceae bacterium]|nr:hypothetical protein [Micromonosporaceae bacterium]
MAGNQTVWTLRRPRRAAGRLAWTAFVACLVCGPAWLLFGDEPPEAADGAVNPLALVVPTLAILFGLALVPNVLALVRRPKLAADHYALTVRPGVARTLILPWAAVAEVATMEIDEEDFLLVRCTPAGRHLGDQPRWWDQANLRSAIRGAPAASAYDLAVPLADFAARPEVILADLAEIAPGHVTLASRAPR